MSLQSMKKCCAATLRIIYGGGVVAVEDALEVGVVPDWGPITEHAEPAMTVDVLPEYERPPAQFSDIMKVSVTTIWRLKLHEEYPLIMEAIAAQAGELEYAVAALCIWLTTPTAQYLCSRVPLHRLKMSRWEEHAKTALVKARQYGAVFGGGGADTDHAFRLRKLMALIGRTMEEADWDKEMLERISDTTPKAAFGNGVVSGRAYSDIRDRVLKRVAEAAVSKVRKNAGSLSEYWLKRWWQSPRGTSSKGADTKRALKGRDQRLDFNMRPIKPTVAETLNYAGLLGMLSSVPRAVARGSTKPEPGKKRRALLAVDDTTAFIAGYASDRIEQGLKLDGMVLQQMPEDVAEWAAFDQGRQVWRVSNDYTNFNILHSLRSLQLVDLAFEKAWSKVPHKWARDKEAACRWVAQSYNDSWMNTPKGTARARCGLWSGHRNTARDNTILHLVYLECVKSVQRALFGDYANTSKQRICGDDEVLAYDHWAPAVMHTLVTDAIGFSSKVEKGLLSRRHDEFLQLMRSPGNVPSYPVAHTILTYCSGNWYKDPVRDLGSTVKDVQDHAWDMVLGGVPVKVAQQLAGVVLDYLMQCKDENGKLVKLEWNNYIGCGLPEGHPLFGKRTLGSPIVTVEKGKLNVPVHATKDSTHKEEPVWKAIGNARRDEIMSERAWQSYRVVARDWLQEQYDKKALEVWPERHTYWQISDVERARIPNNRWRAGRAETVPRSLRAVAVQAGMPPELLGTDDQWKAMAVLRPKDRALLTSARATAQGPTIGWRWEVPPLLRAI
uniref:RNA-directed RNA polymerase n=1 Tax=Conidiobolus heterosporus totivirus 2 TaxID=2980978 RepID=A0A977WKN5_9VIRU|nr:RNA-dependent RNA polymerase [Conidiobolus heterosporus totivirus 2]